MDFGLQILDYRFEISDCRFGEVEDGWLEWGVREISVALRRFFGVGSTGDSGDWLSVSEERASRAFLWRFMGIGDLISPLLGERASGGGFCLMVAGISGFQPLSSTLFTPRGGTNVGGGSKKLTI